MTLIITARPGELALGTAEDRDGPEVVRMRLRCLIDAAGTAVHDAEDRDGPVLMSDLAQIQGVRRGSLRQKAPHH